MSELYLKMSENILTMWKSLFENVCELNDEMSEIYKMLPELS